MMNLWTGILRKTGSGSLRGGFIGGVGAALWVIVWLLLKEITLRQQTRATIDFSTIDFSLLFSLALFVGLPIGAVVGATLGGVIGLITGICKPHTLRKDIAKPIYHSTLRLQ